MIHYESEVVTPFGQEMYIFDQTVIALYLGNDELAGHYSAELMLAGATIFATKDFLTNSLQPIMGQGSELNFDIGDAFMREHGLDPDENDPKKALLGALSIEGYIDQVHFTERVYCDFADGDWYEMKKAIDKARAQIIILPDTGTKQETIEASGKNEERRISAVRLAGDIISSFDISAEELFGVQSIEEIMK